MTSKLAGVAATMLVVVSIPYASQADPIAWKRPDLQAVSGKGRLSVRIGGGVQRNAV
jgi:hypothetical protein